MLSSSFLCTIKIPSEVCSVGKKKILYYLFISEWNVTSVVLDFWKMQSFAHSVEQTFNFKVNYGTW